MANLLLPQHVITAIVLMGSAAWSGEGGSSWGVIHVGWLLSTCLPSPLTCGRGRRTSMACHLQVVELLAWLGHGSRLQWSAAGGWLATCCCRIGEQRPLMLLAIGMEGRIEGQRMQVDRTPVQRDLARSCREPVVVPAIRHSARVSPTFQPTPPARNSPASPLGARSLLPTSATTRFWFVAAVVHYSVVGFAQKIWGLTMLEARSAIDDDRRLGGRAWSANGEDAPMYACCCRRCRRTALIDRTYLAVAVALNDLDALIVRPPLVGCRTRGRRHCCRRERGRRRLCFAGSGRAPCCRRFYRLRSPSRVVVGCRMATVTVVAATEDDGAPIFSAPGGARGFVHFQL
ncbi:hypothetical protein ACLOJK_024322 [Asimina triloba]